MVKSNLDHAARPAPKGWRVRAGLWRNLGGVRPFGYRVKDGALEPHEDERKALLTMRKMHKKGESLRAIAAAMQEHGIKISHQGVKDVLARKPA